MLTCRDAYALIVRTIDDDGLPAEARARLRGHLAACGRCREEYETQHAVRRLLALHVEEPPPAGFESRLSARLARASAPHAAVSPGQAGRWRAWFVRVAIPIAATALLIVADARWRARDVAVPRAPRLATAVSSPAIATNASSPRRDRDGHARHRLQPPAQTLATSPDGDAEAATDAAAASAADIIVEADSLAEALKLTDTQRKQIEEINDQRRQALTQILEHTRKRVALERLQTDAAIERVLTPEQRRQYREQAADRERRASDGWSILPRASTSIPLPPTPSTTPTPSPQPPF
jgi:Spy/CpxP family protein refolding chaperone